MGFKTTKYGRAYCGVGVRIPENTLTRGSFDALIRAVDRIGHKDLKVLGMEPGKPEFSGPSGTLTMPVLVGNVIASVGMDTTKRLPLGPSRKSLDEYRSEESLLHQLRGEVSESLGELLFAETAHFYCVGSFFKLILGKLWTDKYVRGVDLDEAETFGLEMVLPNVNRDFYDDSSRLFGALMATTPKNLGSRFDAPASWARASLDLEQAQWQIVEAEKKGFRWCNAAHLFLCETTWFED